MAEQDKPILYCLEPKEKDMLTTAHWTDVTELIVKTKISKMTYRNLKEVVITKIEADKDAL